MVPFRQLFISCFLLVVCSSAAAKTVYIDDTLYVPLRAGEGTQYRILDNGLRSGTRLQLLQKSDSGYSKVRTPDGKEGWVVSRYLRDTPIAEQQLAAANQELEQTRAQLRATRSELEELRQAHQQVVQSENELETRAANLSQELQRIKKVSADSLSLNRRNKELLEENQKLSNELEVLAAENERLEAKRESDFMLIGAGLVVLGVALALIVPALKPSRKHDQWA
ncbi:MAG: TIGR04211 family SH3 domain-containing protein [Pseudomonadota bacterium]|nr:TIGR04211 family SH3 domain-containing protein [Pseudomonadota bacterium]